MKIIHISMGGPDRKIRDEDGVQFTFEAHPQFGPIVLNRRGDPLEKQPGARASFWRVWLWWSEQGKAIDAEGFCVWAKPPEPKLIHLGGRHYKVVYP
jgi:hypothetical protein